MGDEKLHVYGVTDDSPGTFEADGVDGGSEIYTVEYRSLAAVASDVETLEPEESDENVRVHDEVLREVATRDGGRTIGPGGLRRRVDRGGDQGEPTALRDRRPLRGGVPRAEGGPRSAPDVARDAHEHLHGKAEVIR